MPVYRLGENVMPNMLTPYPLVSAYLPGSAYGVYDNISRPQYGNVLQENIVEDDYLARTEDNMGGVNMFAGDETFGPEAPTAVQAVVQATTDLTGLQKNVLYALGAGVVAYFAYQYFYGE